MRLDRFMIAPMSTGLQTDLKPWLIPDDAFASLNNAYVFRGRVRKRFGGTLMGTGGTATSRLRINIGTTSAVTGNFSATVPGSIFKIGQMFSIGTTLFTVYQTGTPAAMLTTGAATGTYNTSLGDVVITGNGENPLTAVYFYPAEPVMGIDVYEKGPINNQSTYAFDTQFAYTWNSGWDRSGSGSNPLWHGTNTNFFWLANYRGATPNVLGMFVTNFNVINPNGAPGAFDDPIWYTADGSTWSILTPKVTTAGITVQTCRMILPFKNRLVLLNVIELSADGTTYSWYPARARWSAEGDPTAATTAWLDRGQTGSIGGGFVDFPTSEQMVSAEFIKDRLIIYFERSTWELAFTGNEVQPFVPQKINTELGSQSTFSTVPFDKEVLTIGQTGVHSCNGANVARIDNKIPDEVFDFFDTSTAVPRVWGIRDYYVEQVYWSFVNVSQNGAESYPTHVLVYNYKTGCWALNDDCITAFGYFLQQPSVTWATSPDTWEEADFVWGSGVGTTQFRQVIAGNQEGFTFIVDSERPRNAPVLQITNITASGVGTNLTIVDHTLQSGEVIAIENANGVTFSHNQNYFVRYIDNNTVYIQETFTGTYTGGGTVTRVSNISFQSKQWNPYDKQGRDVYLQRIDFLVDRTDYGQITVDYSPSSSNGFSMIASGEGTGSIMGTGVLETTPYALYPFEQEQVRLWHPVYFQTDGECIQLFVSFNAAQLEDKNIPWDDFVLHAMVLHTQPTSQRLQ